MALFNLLGGVVVGPINGVLKGVPVEDGLFFSWVCLDAFLYVVQHVGSKLKKLLALVLFAVDLNRGRVVGEAGHLESTESRCWVPTAAETLFVQLQNTVLFLNVGWILAVVLLHSHQRDILLVDLVLDFEVVDQRAEVVKQPLEIFEIIELGLKLTYCFICLLVLL